MNVAIYLRKSRADLEAEKTGEFETLARHKTTLLELSQQMDLNVLEIKEEIVSGESLISRPKMLELLKEVEDNKYDAVLVMDIDRLGRGGMQDQGVILDTFRISNTKIITPRKSYDLSDEFDEEYSEFEAFMARKELKIIKRRMTRGRYNSAKNGSFAYSNPPLGYDIKKTNKDYILIPNKDAETVKMIFNLYVNYGLGFNKIGSCLDESGVKTINGGKWNPSTISGILENVAYIGYVTWQNSNREKETQIFKGLHESIIDEETFNKAKEIRKTRQISPRTRELRNPLAGLLICGVCGKNMIMRRIGSNNNPRSLVCRYKCGNRFSLFDDVEKTLISSLENTLNNYIYEFNDNKKINSSNTEKNEFMRKNLKNLKNDLIELEKQQNSAYDLLERKIYTEEVFLKRMNNIKDRIVETTETINNLQEELKTSDHPTEEIDIINKIRNVIEAYDKLDSIQEKNELLKTIIDSVKYYKEDSKDNFKLEIILKLNKA